MNSIILWKSGFTYVLFMKEGVLKTFAIFPQSTISCSFTFWICCGAHVFLWCVERVCSSTLLVFWKCVCGGASIIFLVLKVCYGVVFCFVFVFVLWVWRMCKLLVRVCVNVFIFDTHNNNIIDNSKISKIPLKKNHMKNNHMRHGHMNNTYHA